MPRINNVFEYRFVEPGYRHPKGWEVVELAPGAKVEMRDWGVDGAFINQPVIDLIAARMEDRIAEMQRLGAPPEVMRDLRGRLRSDQRTVLVKIRIPV